MDYCSSCRRHLNGALVCPGCGAYAPDIAPPSTANRTADRMDHGLGDGLGDGLDDGLDDGLGPDLSAETAGVAVASEGRAARRRQRARWKKNQRRAVVATAVALVGGGLTVASLDRHSHDKAQAAAVPDDRPMGDTTLAPGPAGGRTDSTPPPAAHRATPTASRTQDPTGAAPTGRHRRASIPEAPSMTRPDAVAPPRPVTPATLHTHTTVPSVPDNSTGSTGTGTGTATKQPAPAPSTGTGTGTGTGSHSSPSSAPATSPSTPTATSPNPNQICLVLLCLG
ncbi:SCO2400 family protein [Streptomyces sp. NPDC002676]